MYRNSTLVKLVLALFILGFTVVSCNDKTDKQEQASALSGDPKVNNLKLPDGFKADRLFGPSENQDGSWVSMTFDDKGRIIASDQYGSLYRLTVPPIGDTSKAKIEKIGIKNDPFVTNDTSGKKVSIGFAHGLLYAFNSLYVVVSNMGNDNLDKKSGLYRLQDTDGDDEFDKVTLLKSFQGDGEHGPHSVVLSPDKKSLYIAAGNFTDIPKMDVYKVPGESKIDNLLPLIKDPNGHDNTVGLHGGWVAHIDSTGSKWELVSSGFRNEFDVAFNDLGDMFTYDSDMEWDFGTPWYRPTRICHVTSGSEFGWRPGTDKWAPYFPDNLPALVNVGQGSPTNVVSGLNSKFPEKYRKAIFAFDWSFGIIYAITLEPDGASYKASGEEFVSGSPLPLTDGVIGPDGAMYFLTGGRRLESDLYRVYYTGKLDEKDITPTVETPERKLRTQLEAYHSGPQAGAIDAAWPQLKHADRHIRYAARIAVEQQPLKEWQDKALAEKDPVTLTQVAIALARHGAPTIKGQLLHALAGIDFNALSEAQQLDLTRAIELVIARLGAPDAAGKAELGAYLDKQYPAKSNDLNRQLSKILLFIDAPNAVQKTVALLGTAKDDKPEKTLMESSDLIMRNPQYGMDIAGMLAKTPPLQQTFYAIALSTAKNGWTPELRQSYFKWFYLAFSFKGGHSFRGFINNARKAALENVPKAEFAMYNTLSGDSIVNKSGNALADDAPQPKGPGRRWTMEEGVPVIDSGLNNRNFENGKAMFAASLCISCHTMKGEGGTAGPDLTQLGTRFSAKDILEAIIDPSKTISDQYGATVLYLKDGGSVVGRIVTQDDQKYSVSQNPFAPQVLRDVPKKDVIRTRVSEVSPMLPGMVNRLNSDELRDLLAYLVAGGNKDNPIYTGKK